MSGADGEVETAAIGDAVALPSTDAASKRLCLLVLGMHRSGTSALTRLLSLAGAELPAHLMGASEGNEAGHWESQALVDYNDRLLTELGSTWYDWRPIDFERLPPRRRAEIAREIAGVLKNEYGDARTIVVKDPRICRLAPLFIEGATEAGFECRILIAFRSPLEVSQSLERRNAWLTRGTNVLLWLRHVVDAVAATRSASRAFVSYDNVLGDWRASFARFTRDLGLTWPRDADAIAGEADQFLSNELRHHSSTAKDVMVDALMRDWIGDAYTALLALERRPDDREATQALEAVAREFNNATPVINALLAEADAAHSGRLRQLQIDAEGASQRLEHAAVAVASLEASLAATQHAAERNATERTAAERVVAEQHADLAALRLEAAERMNALGQAQSALADALARSESASAAASRALNDREASLASARNALSISETQRQALDASNTERGTQIEALAESERRARSELGKMQEWLTSIQQETKRLRLTVAERDEQLNAMGTSTSWRITRPLRGLKRAISDPEFRRALPYRLARSAARRLNLPVTLRARAKALGARLGLIYTGAPVQIAPVESIAAPSPEAVQRRSLRGDLRYRALWVVNDSDLQTQKYRVFNYAEELARHKVESVIVREVELHDIDVTAFDIVTLNRVAANDQARAMVERCRQHKIPVRYDIDDLVFDVDRMPLLRATAALAPDAYKLVRNGIAARREMMLACDAVTTSTAALAREIRALGLPAYVMPNTIGRADLEAFSASPPPREAGAPVRIGYFSGTKTHEHDFACCADALVDVLKGNANTELMIVGELELPAAFEAFGARIVRRPLMSHQEMLHELRTLDINLAPLELDNAFTACKSELKIFEAALMGVPTVASPTPPFAAIIEHRNNGMLAETREEWRTAIEALVTDRKLRETMGRAAKEQIVPRFSIETAALEALAVDEALITGRAAPLPEPMAPLPATSKPLITVVAILYNKRNEVRYFLESLARQDFGGPFEVLLVNDCTADDSVGVVEDFYKWRRIGGGGADMALRIIENQTNLGNCASRNRAIAEAAGDIVVIVDADCMLNQSFLTEHYRAHSHGDCDAAIGPMNIETNGQPPHAVLDRFEADLQLRIAESAMQDERNLDSFVNCVTRNFSISARFIRDRLGGELFDNQFAYSRDPLSGFGWEDVEMGCRLYAAGARIRFLRQTFSIHVTHPSTTGEATKPLRSLKNFRRLFDKHPDLIFTARQWAIRTHGAIKGWAAHNGQKLEGNEDAERLAPVFARYDRVPIAITRPKRLRVLTHRWHVPHQYELYRSGHDFTLVTGAGTAMCDSWEWDKRPMPSNARFVRRDDIDFRDYDVALLHFDENVLAPERCLGKAPMDWGATLDWFIREAPLPKVGICHGTPQFAGQFDGAYAKPDLGVIDESARARLADYVKDVLVVCNSHQAQHEWNFAKSTVVWHGFAPHDYPEGARQGAVLTMLGAALTNRPHYNGRFVAERVQTLIGNEIEYATLHVPEPPESYAKYSPAWSEAKFRNYARAVGNASIYLNPTLRSPMPRSRGEAMMLGLATASMRNHDVDLFVRNGANGFFADSADELAEQILFLSRNPAALARMQTASRRTALDVFNQDRYLAAWSQIFSAVG